MQSTRNVEYGLHGTEYTNTYKNTVQHPRFATEHLVYSGTPIASWRTAQQEQECEPTSQRSRLSGMIPAKLQANYVAISCCKLCNSNTPSYQSIPLQQSATEYRIP